MPKVFTVVPGLDVRIDRIGVARFSVGLDVSDAVAKEVASDKRLRVEREPAPAPRLAPKPLIGKKSKTREE